MSGAAVDRARVHLDAREFERCRAAALDGLSGDPENPDLLRMAGLAEAELGHEDAVEHLRRVAELRPDEANAWLDLGDALTAEGLTAAAVEAFERAVQLEPDNAVTLSQLGHLQAALGHSGEAIDHLARAAARGGGGSTAAISLVEMYKTMGKLEEALAAASAVAEALPDDVLAVLDVADLSLSLGRLDDAASAFQRLRDVDDMPDHDVYTLHGLIYVEMMREDWSRALELAGEASRIDSHGSTGEVRAFLEARVSLGAEGAVPARAQVDAALAASHAEHRRLHLEDRRLEAEDLG